MNAVIRLNKSDSKIAQFIQRARSTDTARPVLNGINVNGNVVACHGWRLHAVESSAIPDIGKMEGLTVDIGKRSRPGTNSRKDINPIHPNKTKAIANPTRSNRSPIKGSLKIGTM